MSLHWPHISMISASVLQSSVGCFYMYSNSAGEQWSSESAMALGWRAGAPYLVLSCILLSCLVYRSGWAAVQSYDGGSSVAVLTDRARGAASLGDGSLEYILHRHATGGNGA